MSKYQSQLHHALQYRVDVSLEGTKLSIDSVHLSRTLKKSLMPQPRIEPGTFRSIV